MALQALQSIYWPGDGQVNAVPVTTTQYPAWQAAVTAGALVLAAIAGMPMPLAVATVTQASGERTPLERLVKRGWQVSTPLRRRVPDRWWLLLRLVRVLWSPEFDRARAAVRQVAVTPGMRESRMWGAIGQRAGAVPGVGENVFRHLLALEHYGAAPGRQGHVRDTALQLAYLALKDR